MSDLTMKCACGFYGRVTDIAAGHDVISIVTRWIAHKHEVPEPVPLEVPGLLPTARAVPTLQPCDEARHERGPHDGDVRLYRAQPGPPADGARFGAGVTLGLCGVHARAALDRGEVKII
jgi:hypothetical protein